MDDITTEFPFYVQHIHEGKQEILARFKYEDDALEFMNAQAHISHAIYERDMGTYAVCKQYVTEQGTIGDQEIESVTFEDDGT